ncbi:LysR substrate-binding domain-containing protein [Plastorhodobacter daqingensis]|uniref:LysR substrate-binding domain-containing protein n=1 Tax=Plastorhodobacter daqingensis TaxID=1387281 RepID=A0ABW2UHM1_9RHOB
MKLKDLEAYRAVLVSGSTQAAAEILGISQSAVSRRISQLEEDLGLQLFVRDRVRLVPTRAGRHLDQHAQDVLERAFFLSAAAEEARQGRGPATVLRVAVPASMSRVILPGIIAAFLRQQPDLRFEVLHGPYDAISGMLQTRQADIGLLRLPVSEPGLEFSDVVSAASVCVMPKGHRLCALSEVQPFDLRQEELVLLGWRRAPRRDLDLAFAMAGITPNVRVETHSVSSACGLVAQGIGVSIVNALLVQECLDLPIVIRPFRPALEHRFVLAYAAQPELSEIARQFVIFAGQQLARLVADAPD